MKKEVDTSMGFTWLSGLRWATRTADLDLALVLTCSVRKGCCLEQIDRLLNKESGLLGVGGAADLRQARILGEPRPSWRWRCSPTGARKYIGAYASVLEGSMLSP
ncbi:MAG: hypothetical protein U0840_28320 [Gemmataceae bacterium]